MSDTRLKTLPDRPALPAELTVKTENGCIILEPGLVHGTRGFTVVLSRERAKALGHALIDAAVRLLPATTRGGAE